MITWRDYLVEDDRRREMLDWASRQRQTLRFDYRSDHGVRWYRVMVVRLGAWVETMGHRLQASDGSDAYSDVPITPTAGKLIEGC